MFERRNIFIYAFISVFVLLGCLALAVLYYPDWRYEKTVKSIREKLKNADEPSAVLQDLEKAYATYPEDDYFQNKYFSVLAGQDVEMAIQQLQALEAAAPLDEPLLRTLAQSLKEADRLEEANKSVIELLKINSQSAENLKLAGEIAYSLGDLVNASALFNAAYKRAPEDMDILFYRARVFEAFSSQLDALVHAKADLLEVASSESKHQAEALTILAFSARLPLVSEDRQFVMQQIAALPSFEEEMSGYSALLSRKLITEMAGYSIETALRFAEILIQREEATLEDKVFFVQLAQERSKPDLAKPVIDAISAEQPRNPIFLNMRARNSFLLEKVSLGMEQLANVLEEDPNNLEALSTLFVILKGDWVAVDRASEFALAERFFAHPEVGYEQLLDICRTLSLKYPERRQELLNLAVERLKESHLIELGFWLNQMEAYDLTLRITPREQAQQSVPLSINYCEAWLGLERFSELDAWLKENAAGMPQLQKELLLCFRFIESGALVDARRYWNSAFALAEEKGDGRILRQLAQKAPIFKDNVLIAAAFSMSRLYGARLSLLDWHLYFNALIEEDQVLKAYEITKLIIERYPESSEFENNYLYLSLLLNKSVNDIAERLKRLVAEHANELSYQVTLALAYHKSGLPSKAVETIESVYSGFVDQSPSARAVYAVILGGSGNPALAVSIARNIDKKALLTPERQLITSLLAPLDALDDIE